MLPYISVCKRLNYSKSLPLKYTILGTTLSYHILMIPEAKLCRSCQKPVFGRSDKQFCDDYCRNTYNTHLKSNRNNYIRRVNSALLKNRKLLKSLLPDGQEMAKVHEKKLISLGFQFRYHTHTYTTKKGHHYIFCYEYGYLSIENNWYLLVRGKENPVDS